MYWSRLPLQYTDQAAIVIPATVDVDVDVDVDVQGKYHITSHK